MAEQSSSGVNNFQESSGNHPYPPPLATYEKVRNSPELFIDTLKKFHSSMGTKFKIPTVGGKSLDLYRLFIEVTSRGGILKVVKDNRWKEVNARFSFPVLSTSASTILRKHYVLLLYHYEQVYLFNAKYSIPLPAEAILQHLSTIKKNAPTISIPEEGSIIGSTVYGVIDEKFKNRYLVTFKIGSEDFRGVLYHVPNDKAQRDESSRKNSEIRKQDPALPKRNRSSYCLFFAERNARLKQFYKGKDAILNYAEISRIIGESWSELEESERAVYEKIALKDKVRYNLEMEAYRERLRSSQIVQQQQQENMTVQFENDENEMSSDKSAGDEDSDEEMELKDVDIGIMDDEALNSLTRCDGKSVEKEMVSTINEGISVPIEQREQQQQPTKGNESV